MTPEQEPERDALTEPETLTQEEMDWIADNRVRDDLTDLEKQRLEYLLTDKKLPAGIIDAFTEDESLYEDDDYSTPDLENDPDDWGQKSK